MSHPPKVFISYSWTNQEYQNKVIEFAQRLTSDGIYVVADFWDLKEGDDMYSFMESMVTSSEISKVLILVNEEYTNKANIRKGGVGTETQIISPELYNKASQNKYIPVIFDLDSNNEPAKPPVFLQGRIYRNLAIMEEYEKEYEDLTRCVFEKPLRTRPQVGNPPSYLEESIINPSKSTFILRSFDSQIERNPKRVNILLKDFFDSYITEVQNCKLITTSNQKSEIGKEIVNNLKQQNELKNNFVTMIDRLTLGDIDFSFDIFTEFLEKLAILHNADSRDYLSLNYVFIVWETFLTAIGVGLKNKNYSFIAKVLHQKYFIRTPYSRKSEICNFMRFKESIFALNDCLNYYYKATEQKEYSSPISKLVIKRAPDLLNNNELIQADIICFYVARTQGELWFPILYEYMDRTPFLFFERLIFKKHFEDIKCVFGFDNREELIDFFSTLENDERIGYPYYSSMNKFINQYIDIGSIATIV